MANELFAVITQSPAKGPIGFDGAGKKSIYTQISTTCEIFARLSVSCCKVDVLLIVSRGKFAFFRVCFFPGQVESWNKEKRFVQFEVWNRLTEYNFAHKEVIIHFFFAANRFDVLIVWLIRLQRTNIMHFIYTIKVKLKLRFWFHYERSTT